MGPFEEKVLPSIEFPAHSMVASHPSGVDGNIKDSVPWAPIHVQPTSTHDHAITSPDEPFKLPQAGPYGQGSASVNDFGQSLPAGPFQQNHKKSAGLPTSGDIFHPKCHSFKGGRRKYNRIL